MATASVGSPGCGTRAFTHAHHIVWWERGGRTDLDNLVLLCSFHHRLVHEYGWTLARQRDGTVEWFRPDGAGYLAGPREGLAAVASV
ncbi:MAG: HNH endonuclease signature motif containing protein [Actinomycetota bacterium]